MKFMLMMNAPYGTGDDIRTNTEAGLAWGVAEWPPDDVKAMIDFMIRFKQELSDAGELVGAEGLAPPGQARVVRAGKGGAPEVTDGPFPEAKEFLAGYWIVDVERPERAHQIAARHRRGHGARSLDRPPAAGTARRRSTTGGQPPPRRRSRPPA
jgi:hypothetical protein